MIRIAALALLLATPALAGTVNEALEPDPEGRYSYTPPETKTEGAYQIELRDSDGTLRARLRNTQPRLGEGHLTGRQEWFHPNGTLARKVTRRMGEEDGEFREFDEEGRLIRRGEYDMGRPAGIWTRVWPSGQTREERHFEDGQEVGLSRRWARDGTLIAESEFTEDGTFVRERRWRDGELASLREAVTIEGHGEGEKLTEYKGNFTETDTKAEGYRLTTRHLGDKLLDRSEVIDGHKQGRYVYTDPIDNITWQVGYVDNEEHGLYTRTWRGEVLERGLYDHGKRVGPWKRMDQYGITILETYDEEGRLEGERRMIGMNEQLVGLETYRAGTLDGPYEELTRDGEILVEGTYANGEKTGLWQEKVPYRAQTWRGRYEDGEKDGRWDMFNGDFYLAEVRHYEAGDREGLTYLFSDDGAVAEVQVWRGDARDGYTTYYEDGVPFIRDLWRGGVLEQTDIEVTPR